MYENTNPFLTSEIEYRRDRIRSGVASRRRRPHVRFPLVRRPADTSSPRTSVS